MKILVCIASYGRSQWEYLDEILTVYRDMNHQVDVILDVTEERPEGWTEPVVETNIHPPSIGKELVFEHRETMANRAGEYDLYIYSEDDILIKEKNITAYLSINSAIPDEDITGFLRYELSEEDPYRYLTDCHPQTRKYHPIDRNPRRRIFLDKQVERNRKEYFRLWNLHQGSWILTDKQLSKALESKGFYRNPSRTKHRPKWWRSYQWYGILESGATDIYTRCGFNHKILPKEDIEQLLIHHMSDRFVKNDVWDDPWPLTLKELRARLEDRSRVERRWWRAVQRFG